MNKRIIIDHKYCGYKHIGNGGYVCGVVAGHIDGAAKITLVTSPPVDHPMILEKTGKKVFLKNGDVIVAKGEPSSLKIDNIPAPPTFKEAVEASQKSIAAKGSLSPDCFVCGSNRLKGEGYRLFPGHLLKNESVAAPWIPHNSLADESGFIKPEFVWAALDCPGAYAVFDENIKGTILLGQLTADVRETLKPEEEYIVTGWKIGNQGKKYFAGSAVFSKKGKLCSVANSVWFVVDQD
ncbi:MAG TPA: hypothetical protein DD405_01380 [Desulfobacteraceae bacterium]|nr:hypothetical protein [Desulfobacteraceae bacterium]